MQALTATGIAENNLVHICTGTAPHLSTGSADPTKIDPSYQGRATCAIPTLLDLHFNSQQARRHMRLFGRTLQLHHAHSTRFLSLPISYIRNTSSRTAAATWKGSQSSCERKSVEQLRAVANLSLLICTNSWLLTR